MEIPKNDAEKITEELRKAHFAVFYTSKGEPFIVIGPNGKQVDRKRLSQNPIQDVIGLEHTAVVSKEGKSPCCVVNDDWEWCWC